MPRPYRRALPQGLVTLTAPQWALLVAIAQGGAGGRRRVELRASCGQRWGQGFEVDARTIARAAAGITQLDAAAQALGLEVRGGRFTEDPDA